MMKKIMKKHDNETDKESDNENETECEKMDNEDECIIFKNNFNI